MVKIENKYTKYAIMFILGFAIGLQFTNTKTEYLTIEHDMAQEERQKYNDIMEEATNVINYLESRDCNE